MDKKNPNNGCLICYNTLSLCSSCEIKKLKHQVAELTEVVNFLCGESNRQLIVSKKYKSLIEKNFHRYAFPAKEFPKIQENDYIFITLTFDPERFGSNNDSEDEKQYLLYIITKLVESNNLFDIYGSFEYQRNGSIHCHFISKFSDYSYIKKQLTRDLTNRPRNDKAVDIRPVKGLQKLWNYINKEPNGKEWFVTYNSSYYDNECNYDLDYGLSKIDNKI